MKFELKVLSYIHIGNGQEISNWSYSVDNNKINIYNFDKVVSALNRDKQMYLTSMIEKNHNSKCLGDFIKAYKINVSPEYTLDYNGKIFDGKIYKNIKEFIKQNKKVYIPGSEIKGSIRTAFFYKILKDKINEDEIYRLKLKERLNKLLKDLENPNEKGRELKKFSEELEDTVFINGFREDLINDKSKKASKSDILRFLLISDSDLKDPKDVLILKNITSLRVSKNFSEPHEVLKSRSSFEIDLKFTIEEGYKSILPETQKYLSLENLVKSCNEFAEAKLKADIEYFSKSKEIDEDAKQKLLGILQKRLELIKKLESTYIFLRIGKNQGFLSTTIALVLKEYYPDIYQKLYKHLVHKGYLQFPNKSRKITEEKDDVLGWCVLIPKS